VQHLLLCSGELLLAMLQVAAVVAHFIAQSNVCRVGGGRGSLPHHAHPTMNVDGA
jgi:hypothetical protein